MKNNFTAVCFLFWTVLSRGQNLEFRDDFSRYSNGVPPAAIWESLTGKWLVQDKQLVPGSLDGGCAFRQVPELDSFDYSAQVVIPKRISPSGWATAGAAMFLDQNNHWRLNLVEGPDNNHYVEFGETLDGKWQAQNEGSTKLSRNASEFTHGKWEYGKTYSMRIKLSPQDIYGEVKEADDGHTIAKFRYLWDNKDGVKFGRPGFSANGLSMACNSVAVSAPRPGESGARTVVENGQAGRVAVVKDFPGANAAVLNSLAERLRQAGYGVTLIAVEDFASTGTFSAMDFDYVVLAGTRYFPMTAKNNFLRFLRSGGHCVVLGGNIFEESLVRLTDHWCSQDEFERVLAETKPDIQILDPAKDPGQRWSQGADVPQSKTKTGMDSDSDGKCVRFDINEFNNWATFSQVIPPFQSGQTLLCFRAKGDAATPQITVEIDEKDGSRWIAVADIKPEWDAYVLAPERFAPWESKAIGKHALTPGNAARISFGIAKGFTPRVAKGKHSFWIGTVGTASNRLGQIDFSQKVALNFFYDYEPYRLTDVVSVGKSQGNNVTPQIAPIKGGYGGLSAVGFAYPNESKFIPLLSTFDKYGRDRGWAGGMLVNYAGSYRGSSWIFSGITNQDFYTQPAVLDTLVGAMKAVKGDLPQQLQNEEARGKTARLPVNAPAPHGFIHLSADGKHFIYPNGRRFFMSGCNYVGPFDRCGGRMWKDDYFDVAAVEEDFRKSHEAGLNCMRYWVSGIDKDIQNGDFRKVEAIKECARKYGVYLLLHLPGTSYPTVEEMVASHKAIAGAFKDEPMVLGYDLRNEPFLGTVASLQYPASLKPPVLTQDLRQLDAGLLSQKYVNEIEAQRPNWLRLSQAIKGREAENAVAAILLWGQYAKAHNIDSASFPGIVDRLPEDKQFKNTIAVVNDSFARWMELQIKAIRSVDTNHLITVGYDKVFSCLPANRQLDFISQHVYVRPNSLTNVLENITTLDRLAAVWPAKPVTLGEFGYSTGMPMAQGDLDRYTASVGEMIHYLYAFSKNYDGVKKWMLNDWPYKIMIHYGDWNKGDATRRYEERFGLYYYDGTPAGRPKPIVHALRFFGDYIRDLNPSGELAIVPAGLDIGAGYVYRNNHALFAGNTTFSSPNLEFTADHPANVMLVWNKDELQIMASADARVKLVPAGFGNYGTNVTGTYGALKREGNTLQIDMLEGERLHIR